jgi:hypothetical protein
MSNYADDANALNRADAASVSIGPSAGTATRNITTSTNTQVKTGAGIFNGLNVNTGQSGASIKVYDGTDNTGRLIGTYSAVAVGGAAVPAGGLPFTTGLFVVTAGGSPADVTVYYS